MGIALVLFKMLPGEMFTEETISTYIKYGLYFGAAFQLMFLLGCATLNEEQYDPYIYDQPYTDSDECSSEHSSPGHQANQARRTDKKKRR